MNWLQAATDLYGSQQQGSNQGGGGMGGWGFSQSGSADSGPISGDFGSQYGGINTGRQGMDLQSMAVVAAVVLLGLWLLRR